MKVTQVRCEPGDRILIPGDLHFDKQDQEAIDCMLAAAESVGVNSVCLVGDTFESAGISAHKQMRTVRAMRGGGATIKAEAVAARASIKRLTDLSETGKRHVLTGNHEHWWSLVQDDYPGLLDTPWFELYGDLFDGWHVHQEHTAIKYGPLLVCHGHRLRGSLSKYSAASVLNNYPGQNTYYGHVHRLDSFTAPTFKNGSPVAHGAWTPGHMKNRDVELTDSFTGPHSEKHQQGFGIVTIFDRGAKSEVVPGFDVQLCRIHRDTDDKPFCVVDGQVFYA